MMVSHALPLLLPWLLALAHIHAVTDPDDLQALMQVKAGLDAASIPPGSCVSTWDFSVDPCDSALGPAHFSCGIECRPSSNGVLRVTALKLDGPGYRGTLAPAVGDLASLQYLQVGGNALRGTVPRSIGHLSELLMLDLSMNLFSGLLPESIGMLGSLQILSTSNNALRGAMPDTIGLLTNLVECRLNHNVFSGPLPDLGALQQLQLLDISNNSFSGSIPLQFPPQLTTASFRNNLLTGSFTKMHVDGLSPVLLVLDLSGNRLSGAIDVSLFDHPSLQQLNLANNSFNKIDNLDQSSRSSLIESQMVAIDMSNNEIEGILPPLFASMPRLSSLSMSHNAFSGPIHVSYAIKALAGMFGLHPLQRLMLDDNYLTGPLPALFERLLPENTVASFVDNCLLNCPPKFFFCQGADQKPSAVCRLLNMNV